jgi:hypothetical protein
MIPHLSYRLARSLRSDDLSKAEASRLRRAARSGAPGPYGAGVIDALGHGLIAIGARLVSDPSDHPRHRRAA